MNRQGSGTYEKVQSCSDADDPLEEAVWAITEAVRNLQESVARAPYRLAEPPSSTYSQLYYSQPYYSQPCNSQPNNSQPYNIQPYNSQPYNSQPCNSQPNNSQPCNSQPNNSQPCNSQPNNSQPCNSQPNISQPYNSQPCNSQPNNSQPCNSQPHNSQPCNSQPNNRQPCNSQPNNRQPYYCQAPSIPSGCRNVSNFRSHNLESRQSVIPEVDEWVSSTSLLVTPRSVPQETSICSAYDPTSTTECISRADYEVRPCSPSAEDHSPSASSMNVYEEYCENSFRRGDRLLWAARDGQTKLVRKLLDQGVDINFSHASKWTALHRAAKANHVDVVMLLLKRGANVHARANCDFTALHMAAASDSSGRVVSLLLAAGADIGSRTRSGRTPLHYATEAGNASAVRKLVAAGACVSAVDDEGLTPFDVARAACVRQLLLPTC